MPQMFLGYKLNINRGLFFGGIILFRRVLNIGILWYVVSVYHLTPVSSTRKSYGALASVILWFLDLAFAYPFI